MFGDAGRVGQGLARTLFGGQLGMNVLTRRSKVSLAARAREDGGNKQVRPCCQEHGGWCCRIGVWTCDYMVNDAGHGRLARIFRKQSPG